MKFKPRINIARLTLVLIAMLKLNYAKVIPNPQLMNKYELNQNEAIEKSDFTNMGLANLELPIQQS
jgi:hypothetical protein